MCDHRIRFDHSVTMIHNYTSLVIGAPGIDPKLLRVPVLSSMDALVASINEAFPILVDGPISPGLTFSDGSSQRYFSVRIISAAQKRLTCSSLPSSISLPNSPRSYIYDPPTPLPYADYGHPFSPTTTTTSSASPNPPVLRVLVHPPCAGGKPVKQKGGGYSCSLCFKNFKRRDEAKRHIETAGMQVECRYCGKRSCGRPDGWKRHLKSEACQELWEAGRKAGRFTERSREDAYYY